MSKHRARHQSRGSGGSGGGGLWSRIKGLFGGGGPKLSPSPYKGAERSRSKSDWTTQNPGPNKAVQAALPTLVARHNDLTRNDPHIKRVVSVYDHALVGTGLIATARHDGTPLGKAHAAAADEIWRLASKRGVLDVMGLATMAGLQAQQARTLIAGNVFVRRIWDQDAPLGMWIQVLEGDLLDRSKNQALEGGARIRGGVQLNRRGRVVGYWLLNEHPGESSIGLGAVARSGFVPVEDCLHMKMPDRAGQLEGVPITSSVMAAKKDVGDFEAFTIIAKKQESCTVGVVTRQPYNEWNPAPEPGAPQVDEQGNELEPDVVVPGVVNNEGELVGYMSPGQWLGVEEGADVRFNNPQLSNNYKDFVGSHHQRIAAGTNVPYEVLTGDFANANYSTMRGGMLVFWAAVDALLWNEIIPGQDVIWGWVMEAAWLKGLIETPDVEADWQAPARPSIEPDKDVISDMMLVRAGWKDEDDVIKANGYHPEKLRQKFQQNRKQRELYDIISDADPAKYAWRGAFPPAVQATPLAGELPKGADPGA